MEIDWFALLIGLGTIVVGIGLVVLLLIPIYWWLQKVDQARTRPRPESDRNVLILPRIYLIGMIPLSFWIPPIILYVFVEYFRGRHQITEGGLEYGRVFGSRGRMNWITVRSVRYVEYPKWFRLESHSGEVARVSSYVRDISEFAKVVLVNVPASAFDEQTAEILRKTADGSPPPMM